MGNSSACVDHIYSKTEGRPSPSRAAILLLLRGGHRERHLATVNELSESADWHGHVHTNFQEGQEQRSAAAAAQTGKLYFSKFYFV